MNGDMASQDDAQEIQIRNTSNPTDTDSHLHPHLVWDKAEDNFLTTHSGQGNC